MDWATIESTLEGLIESLSGRPVQWARAPREFRTPSADGSGTVVYLSAGAVVPIGTDAILYEYDALNDRVDTTVVGRRQMTMTIRTESHYSTGALSARSTAELIRTKLSLPSSLQTLRDQGIAQVSTSSALDVSYPDGNRTVDAWAIDWVLSVPSIVAPDGTDAGYIETVEVTANIDGEDGTPLPSPPNYIDKVLP